jgi:diguanylate cyclase (GGDEF)-like protein/PAS domain S-box-containing protein
VNSSADPALPAPERRHRLSRRARRSRLRTRLAAMILLPLVAVVILSYGDLSRLRDDSQSARAASSHIDRVVPLGQLMFHLELEQMVTSAAVQLTNAGVSLDFVRAQYGFDIATMLQQNRDQVDRRLDEINDGELPLATEPHGLVARVINLRPAVDRNTATLDQIERDFGAARSALARVAQRDFDIASAGFAELPDAMTLIGQYRSTQLLFDLVAAQAHGMFAYGNFIVPALRTDRDRLTFSSAVTQKQALLTELDLRFNDAQRVEWATITKSSAFLTMVQTENNILVSMGLRDGVTVDQSALAPTYLGASSTVMNDIGTFAAGEAHDLALIAHDAAVRSQQRLQLSALRSVGFALFTVLLMRVTIRSVVRPLQQVEMRARAVSEGWLDGSPLAPRGPEEVVVVTEAINDLTLNLNRFVAQTTALAAGQLDAPELREPLPGALGRSLQGTIERLRSATYGLRENEMRAKAIVEHAGDAIFTVDGNGLLRQVNAVGARLLGYDAAKLIGTPIRRYLRGDLVTGENSVYQIHGDDIAVALTVSPVEGTPMLTVVARDITLDKQRESALSYAARHDALTGLANRAAFMDELQRVAASSEVATVFFLDLDGFKAVNDQWGHAVGDELLIAVSKRLVAALRANDLGARYGGDEFCAIVFGLEDNAASIRFGQRLIEAIERPFQLGPHNVRISTSVGVVRVSEGLNAADLLRRADIAAYSAKAAGKGRVRIHDPELAAKLRARKAQQMEPRT